MHRQNHIMAGFSLGLQYRRQLAGILKQTAANATILDLDPAEIRNRGVSTLALDFDGVLAPHGAATPLAEVIKWLQGAAAVFGEGRIFILSNKPTDERRQWFMANFPGFRFISHVRKKPFPDGLQKIAELSGCQLSAILMVDDRLLTGMAAALVAGSRPAYIRNPYISMQGLPLHELFFMSIRTVERILIRIVG